jgi:hypothetical protein
MFGYRDDGTGFVKADVDKQSANPERFTMVLTQG